MRVSAYAREQVFLSGNSALRSEWSVAGGDDGEKDSTATMTASHDGQKHL